MSKTKKPDTPTPKPRTFGPGVHVVDEAESPVELARWSAPGPGYYPGRCSKCVDGRVYRTKEFPEAVARGMLR